jgi:chitin synthase
VFLTQRAFHKFEDQLRFTDSEEKRNRLRDAEDPRGNSDPYAPYHAPTEDWNEGYLDNDNNSNAALPLVANATPFQQSDLYEDDFESKSAQSEDYDSWSRFTSQDNEANSHFGSESYILGAEVLLDWYNKL